ncbi:unnamed protein product, partial [Linum tenue]
SKRIREARRSSSRRIRELKREFVPFPVIVLVGSRLVSEKKVDLESWEDEKKAKAFPSLEIQQNKVEGRRRRETEIRVGCVWVCSCLPAGGLV